MWIEVSEVAERAGRGGSKTCLCLSWGRSVGYGVRMGMDGDM